MNRRTPIRKKWRGGVAAAPALKLAPPAEWTVNENDELVYYKMQSMGFARKARNRLGELIFNSIHHPHSVPYRAPGIFCGCVAPRSARGRAIMRGTTILDIEFLTIGDGTTDRRRLPARFPGGVCASETM